MNSQDILAIFDKEANEFTFPMLDNGYVYLAAARLSLYRSSADWAVVFEIFGYSPRSGAPDCAITKITSRLTGLKTANEFISQDAYAAYLKRNRYCEQRFISPIYDDAIYEENCEEYVSTDATHVNLRDQQIAIPDTTGLADAGIVQEDDKLLVFEVARYLAYKHRDLVLANDAERTANLPESVELLARFDDWHHPDLVNSEWPSDTPSFRAIAAMLAAEPYDESAITANSNTHWSNWPDGGTL